MVFKFMKFSSTPPYSIKIAFLYKETVLCTNHNHYITHIPDTKIVILNYFTKLDFISVLQIIIVPHRK